MPAHSKQIEECARSRRYVHFALPAVDPRDRNLANHEIRAAREKKNFDVETKSIELLQRKQQLRRTGAEQLEAALRIVDAAKDQQLHSPIEHAPNHMT
jgi:hypothetical protein